LLRYYYRDGISCNKNLEKVKEYFLTTAKLSYITRMNSLGNLLDKTNLQWFIWFGRAAINRNSVLFLIKIKEQICNFSSGSRNTNTIFAFGQVLKGYINNEMWKIFRSSYNFDNRIKLLYFLIIIISKSSRYLESYQCLLQSCFRDSKDDCKDDMGFER
jgi:hypothetical protein